MSEPLGLELQVMSHRVGAQNRSRVLCENSECSELLRNLPSTSCQMLHSLLPLSCASFQKITNKYVFTISILANIRAYIIHIFILLNIVCYRSLLCDEELVLLGKVSCSPGQLRIHYVAEGDPEFLILLPLLPEHWENKHVPPHTALRDAED